MTEVSGWLLFCAGVAVLLTVGYRMGRKSKGELQSALRPVPGMVEGPLDISFRIADRQKEIDKILVLMLFKNGSSSSLDNGLTAEEAKQMVDAFKSWIDQCLGREMERNG